MAAETGGLLEALTVEKRTRVKATVLPATLSAIERMERVRMVEGCTGEFLCYNGDELCAWQSRAEFSGWSSDLRASIGQGRERWQ